MEEVTESLDVSCGQAGVELCGRPTLDGNRGKLRDFAKCD
jgi:hypothetical protein